jgi:hypothetical protein
MSDPPTPSGPYLRRLELAGERIADAVRRLTQRDRLWVLNAALREALDEPPEAQAARAPRRSHSTS